MLDVDYSFWKSNCCDCYWLVFSSFILKIFLKLFFSLGAKFFDSQVYEFFLFAGLMFVDMIVFSWLAVRYKGIPLELLKDADDEDYNEKKPALEFKASDKEE